MVLITGADEDRLKSLPKAHHFTSNYPLDMPADEVVDRQQAYLEAHRFYGDAFPNWWVNFGPGIAAGFAGARVYAVPDTVWFYPPGEEGAPPPDISDLHLKFDPDNIWWQRVKELTRCAVERWQGQVCVGHTDLGGNLDVLASFLTTSQLLTDLIDKPDQVSRLVTEINQLWLRYYDELDEIIQRGGVGTTCWTPIWSPGRTYMMQCDFSYMISPKMFERFVLPDLAACCDSLDHGFYHLDGKGEIPHLKHLLSLERLCGIQWIPGDGAPPPHEWLPLLKRIRDGGKLVQVFVSAEGARTIVRELGGRGFALMIGDSMQEEEANNFLKLLRQEDLEAA